MFGTDVISDWNVGSPISWNGMWKGKPYQDKGTILEIIPEKKLQYSHFSALSGAEDVPENYHMMTYELLSRDGQTEVSLSQDNNATEEKLQHSQKMWDSMLSELKKLLEN